MNNERGFTLVELIMVIVIIGILAVAAIPQFYALQNNARQAAMNGVASNVQAGITSWHYNKLVNGSDTFPSSLDANSNIACTSTVGDECFDIPLTQAVEDNLWIKMTALTYRYDVDANGTYNDAGTDFGWTYDSSDGSFISLQF